MSTSESRFTINSSDSVDEFEIRNAVSLNGKRIEWRVCSVCYANFRISVDGRVEVPSRCSCDCQRPGLAYFKRSLYCVSDWNDGTCGWTGSIGTSCTSFSTIAQ